MPIDFYRYAATSIPDLCSVAASFDPAAALPGFWERTL
jgi:hypothetical protein